MKFYSKGNKTKIVCELCSHYCSLDLNKTGICGVNKNVGDKVECLVYGYPAVIHVDPVEKKPLYHFLPKTITLSIGTVGCNFKCPFCQNWQIAHTNKINDSIYVSPEEIVNLALKYNTLFSTHKEKMIVVILYEHLVSTMEFLSKFEYEYEVYQTDTNSYEKLHNTFMELKTEKSNGDNNEYDSDMHEIDDASELKEFLQTNNDLLKNVIYEAISRKPKGHDFVIDREQEEIYVPRHMNVTGG